MADVRLEKADSARYEQESGGRRSILGAPWDRQGEAGRQAEAMRCILLRTSRRPAVSTSLLWSTVAPRMGASSRSQRTAVEDQPRLQPAPYRGAVAEPAPDNQTTTSGEEPMAFDCITVEPNKLEGKPCIRGLRI